MSQAANPALNEAALADAGGAVKWGNDQALEAVDQKDDPTWEGELENVFHAYWESTEDTVNEWGFDHSTDRGSEVVGAAVGAFLAKFKELTGFDFYAE